MAKDPICGMPVNEKTGLKLASGGKTYFFCSEHCLRKFAKEHSVPEKEVATCLVQPKGPFYKNKTLIVSAVLALLVFLSYILPFLEPFRKTLFMYFKTIWWAILLGFFLGGIIDYYVPREYISHILAKPKKRTIFYSVILGFFMSACSHGILALSIELHKKGASNPAVVSFLLASPWANLTLTIMLIGFFGLKALYIIVSAIVIAIITGLIFQALERRKLIEVNNNILPVEKDFSIINDFRQRFKGYRFSATDIKGIYSGMLSLGNMVLWWLLIGMGLASLAGAYIPSGLFQNYMGPTLLGLFVTLALATVIEVCSEGSAPMAFEIFRQTGALGNAFVFLMAGVVTDYTEIGLLWHNVGKKTAIWLPVITVPQVIILGIIANRIF
ncbi:MAG: permease [Candidatus Omnitrophota bacterium]|nr:MAG: permease [Candidatus Omnitrophota bacterium]